MLASMVSSYRMSFLSSALRHCCILVYVMPHSDIVTVDLPQRAFLSRT